MNITNAKKAEILIEALPYIKNYAGQTVVIKYGGSAMTDESLKKTVIKDIVLLRQIGVKAVVVHGGGPEISATLNKMGVQTKFVNGLRVTDEESVSVVQMVLAGKINKDLVALYYSVMDIGLKPRDYLRFLKIYFNGRKLKEIFKDEAKLIESFEVKAQKIRTRTLKKGL